MLDWTIMITALSIIGAAANAYGRRWRAANAIWCGYDLAMGMYSQALLFAVYIGFNVVGLRKWKGDHHD